MNQEALENLTKMMAEQHARHQDEVAQQRDLIHMLMGSLKSTAHPDSKRSSDQIMETLSNAMQMFKYDAEAGQTFDVWYRRYENLFTEDAKSLDDFAKIRLVQRKLDGETNDRLLDAILPRQLKDLTFAETVSILKKTFGRHESIFSSRYKCLQTVKDERMDFVELANIVNRRVEGSKLHLVSADQMKCLIYICALQSPYDADIRLRLLTKLDEDTESNPVTLAQIVSEVQRVMSLKHDSAMVGSSSIGMSVQAIRRNFRPSPNTNVAKPEKRKDKQSRPSRPCWQCGGVHYAQFCEFSTHICSICGNKGHKDGYCSCNKNQHINRRENDSNRKGSPKLQTIQINEILNKNMGDVISKRKYIYVTIHAPNINRTTIHLQIDSASDLTVISQDIWQILGCPGTKAHNEIGATSASNNRVPIIAYFECEMGIPNIGEVQSGSIYVTNINGLNLLGIDWINRFDLWKMPFASICNSIQISSNVRTSILEELKNEFKTIFSDTPGLCTKEKAKIYLKPDAKPVYRPRRPVAYAALEAVEEELSRLQNLNIITPIEFSSWAAPIVVVRRPNGRIRICADYSTGLNSSIEPNPYPLPVPDDMFALLTGSKIFSKIDLSDAYLQIEVDDESKRVLAINTHKGLFTFNRLAPGVRSAPGSFQQIVDAMLSGLDGSMAYFDDILVYSKDVDSHIQNLKKLFMRINDYGFRVKLEKCEFFMSEIKYLGVIVNGDGIKSDPAKIAAIASMPHPENVSQLRSFLGAINFYGKFVKQMHELRAPLDVLLRNDVKWEWSDACQKAFDDFKKLLSQDLLLTFYNPKLPVKVSGDASNTGIGATITHVFPDGSEKAIAHASRALTKAEQNYSQIEKEALALVYAVKKFHRFIFGRHFTLVTDHKPLTSLFGAKSGIPVYTANRLQRWAITLLTYNFSIQYKSTHDFGNADILSRLISSARSEDEDYVIACMRFEEAIEDEIEDNLSVLPINRKMIEHATKRDRVLRQIVSYLQAGWPSKKSDISNDEVAQFFNRRESLFFAGGCLMFGDRIVIPRKFRKLMLRQLHISHLGSDAMKMLARSYVYWPKIDENISETARTCSQCAINAKTPVRSLMRSWPRAVRPMERIHTDIAGPINGMFYLISVDSHSMFPEVHECSNITSKSCIQRLESFFSCFGNPETLVTDNGTQFTSAEFKSFCEKRGINHIRTPPYHPMSNGRAERFVDTLKRGLKKMEGEGRTNGESLQQFLQSYRSTPNRRADNMKSPAELFIGRKIRTIFDLIKPPPQQSSDRNKEQEQQYNRHHGARYRRFEPHDLVYAKVYRRNQWHWAKGEIIEKIGHVTYVVMLGYHHVIHSSINQLKPRYEDNRLDLRHLQNSTHNNEDEPELEIRSEARESEQSDNSDIQSNPESSTFMDAVENVSSSDDEIFEGFEQLIVDEPEVAPATVGSRPRRNAQRPHYLKDYEC